MWTPMFLLYLGALHSTASSVIPSPANIAFSSENLRNVLHWSPGNGTSEAAVFTVQFVIYGDSVEGLKGRRVNWRPVRQCTDIPRSWCDLSNETWDVEHGYYGRVRTAVGRKAASKWAVTPRRFDPKEDTTLGPPLISVTVEGANAIITLEGPRRYLPNNHTPVISMATIYPQMTYNVSIRNVHYGLMHHFQMDSGSQHYQVAPQTEYCFSAKATLSFIPMKSQSSPWECITTPQDPNKVLMLRAVWGFVVPCFCICVLAMIGYNYLMGKGQKKPNTLTTLSFHPPPLTLPPDNPNVIIISVIRSEPPDTDGILPVPTRHEKKMADPPPSYFPQGAEEVLPEHDDASVDYGFVAAVPQLGCGGDEEARWRWLGGEDEDNVMGGSQTWTSGGSYEKKERQPEDGRSAGVWAPQAESYLSQTHMPTQCQIEVSTPVHALPSSWPKPPRGEGGSCHEGECPGLFLSTNPQTGLLQVPYHQSEVRRNSQLDGATEEGSETETVALLSAYAAQNIRPTSHTDQSHLLPDSYSFVAVANAQSTQEGDGGDSDEEERNICINWDPTTGRFVFPGIALDGSGQGVEEEDRREVREGGEGEEGESVELRLENVFVRQASEEEEEMRVGEGGADAGWREEDGVLSKWNLVISMEQ